jgi:adhesin/invasin
VITVSSASNNQIGLVGQPLPQPVNVQVTGQSGNPVANVIVTWTVLTGGGAVSRTTSTTDASGNASVIWTVGTAAGENTLRASIATGASATITAIGEPALASAVTIVSGNPQTIAAGATSAALVVKVTDSFGNPIAGTPVTWTTSGTGTLSATSTTTDASGQTSVTVTPTAALQIMQVTATSDALTPAVFTISVP